MINKEQILEKHLIRVMENHPEQHYYPIDEIKSQPEYQMMLEAMTEWGYVLLANKKDGITNNNKERA